MKSAHPFDIIVREAQGRLREHGTENSSLQDVLLAVIGWQTERLQTCLATKPRPSLRAIVAGGGLGAGLVLGAYEAVRRLLGLV